MTAKKQRTITLTDDGKIITNKYGQQLFVFEESLMTYSQIWDLVFYRKCEKKIIQLESLDLHKAGRYIIKEYKEKHQSMLNPHLNKETNQWEVTVN